MKTPVTGEILFENDLKPVGISRDPLHPRS
jgi:hypothetical protein